MIKVLIERVIAEGLEGPYEEVARKVLSAAIQSPGFISGESFKDLEQSNHRIITVTWQNRHSWERWEKSAARFCTDPAGTRAHYPARTALSSTAV